MGIEVGQIIVVNISEGLIGLVSFFDVASDCGKMIRNCKSHEHVFPAQRGSALSKAEDKVVNNRYLVECCYPAIAINKLSCKICTPPLG